MGIRMTWHSIKHVFDFQFFAAYENQKLEPLTCIRIVGDETIEEPCGYDTCEFIYDEGERSCL